MGFEEDRSHFVGSFGPNIDSDATANPIGGRGIDRIQKYLRSSTNWGSTWTRSNPAQDVFVYPLYDAHGNMVRTLSKTSSGGYTVSAETVVDPWGTKLSSGSGEKRDYCASIGHVTDDESGLVYMRARYYEPGMGRFVSEDTSMDGTNWYNYCSNKPIASVDFSGNEEVQIGDLIFRLDKGMHGQDLHIYEKGVEIYSRYANGAVKHKNVIEKLELIVKTIALAVKSGDRSKIAFLRKLLRFGGFGLTSILGDLLRCLIPSVAYTSIDAYAQQDPADFIDTMTIIGRCGK